MAQLQQAFIVDSNYIKINYPGYIESNIDDNSIESFILLAQSINLQSCIGYNMFNHIISNLMQDPTGNSLSAQYQYILINYIQPEVALWAIYNMAPTLLYKFTNKALVTKHSNESVEVGIRELEYIRSQVRNNAEFFDSRIREYITNNVNDFVEYYTTSGVNRIAPKSRVYFGGIYLKRGLGWTNNGGCCNDYPIDLN